VKGGETMNQTQQISLDLADLRAGLLIRYGDDGQTFAIPGRELENFVLQQFAEMKKKQVAASLN